MPSRTGLRPRMVAALLGLLVVSLLLAVGVAASFYGVFALFADPSIPLAAGAAALTLGGVGVLEYRSVTSIERLADAEPVDRETAPDLYGTATRVAAQLSVPVPTIALSDRGAPEALVVGFRPNAMHLVLSRGTVEALDDDELAAVIAYELAHVANRDAMVVTAVSLPVVLADGLRTRTADVAPRSWAAILAIPLRLVSTLVWIAGRTILSRLTRVRERAADRAAATATGSPAALASALTELDESIADTPNRDLRAASGVSSLSILPLQPWEREKVMLGPDGEREPSMWWLTSRLYRLERRLFGSHPRTEDRVASLRALARDRETVASEPSQ
ncbi:MAG: M48 family metalloprotease [Halolamina sp.]